MFDGYMLPGDLGNDNVMEARNSRHLARDTKILSRRAREICRLEHANICRDEEDDDDDDDDDNDDDDDDDDDWCY